MLPLAMIVHGRGHEVEGSDRSLDQGRIAAKFDDLRAPRHRPVPAGRQRHHQRRPDRRRLRRGRGSCPRHGEDPRARRRRASAGPSCSPSCSMPRQTGIAVGGTSGKSTVTGMIGWILHAAGRDPTVMNGAVMKNFVSRRTSPSRAPWSAAGPTSSARWTRATARSRSTSRTGRGAQQRHARPQEARRAPPPVPRLRDEGRHGRAEPRRRRDPPAGRRPAAGQAAHLFAQGQRRRTIAARDIVEEPFAVSVRG